MGRRVAFSWRICTFDECFLLLLGQWNLFFPKRACQFRTWSALDTKGICECIWVHEGATPDIEQSTCELDDVFRLRSASAATCASPLISYPPSGVAFYSTAGSPQIFLRYIIQFSPRIFLLFSSPQPLSVIATASSSLFSSLPNGSTTFSLSHGVNCLAYSLSLLHHSRNAPGLAWPSLPIPTRFLSNQADHITESINIISNDTAIVLTMSKDRIDSGPRILPSLQGAE
jgi:hypothetical protein